ncbi:integrase core domain-containing protein [Actinacidiphila glaucinigra]|uniref:integrase core domain-containing protein n=1 Tax=Actinacidiphila glaucinigra TaxID=235986 RepID=UPI003673B6D9
MLTDVAGAGAVRVEPAWLDPRAATASNAGAESAYRPARRHRCRRLRRLPGRLVRQRNGRGAERHLQGRAEMPGPWRDFDQVERAIFQWVTWYNEERLHSALEYVTARRVRTRLLAEPGAHPAVRLNKTTGLHKSQGSSMLAVARSPARCRKGR